ncbi:unnamed protein product [Caenorhabditis bovis]|uniref:galactosylceramidase n=1 Tax=Caenorhabditis bovis TaxID=2654633 RepID=A0A8S1ENJ0_9PELO|nr:unnamed protein product [Caenorhabditis bovis]
MFIFFLLFLQLCSGEYVVDVSKAFQQFDGIGAISGGGATSKLLFSYFPKREQREKIMEILFNKINGLQLLKVEMGGDDQSTEGSESSHESEKDMYNTHTYEFRLIDEARKVNSDLKICVLPWTFPGWLGKSPYENATLTIEYVLDWLKIALKLYHIDIYCVGIWNERNFSENYTKLLREALDKNDFRNVKIVAGEGFKMDESYSRLLNENFKNVYDVIGTFIWHLVSAFYPQIAWYRCGLAYLDEHKFRTEVAFQALQYTTGHAKPGWKICSNGYGSGELDNGGTYVTYTNGEHFSIIIETMTYERSKCEYYPDTPYKIKASQKIKFKLPTGFKQYRALNVSFNYESPSQIAIIDRTVELEVGHNSIGVLTTLPIIIPRMYTRNVKLPEKYEDNFEDYEYGDEPRYWMPQKGGWEVRRGSAVQKTLRPPISWCTSNILTPYAVMKFRNTRNFLKVAVKIPPDSTANSTIIGLQSSCSGCDIEKTNCRGIFAEINFNDSILHVFADFVTRTTIAKINLDLKIDANKFHQFQIRLVNHKNIQIKFDNILRSFEISHSILEKTKNDSLFVIGTGNFGISIWDDINVA